MSFRQIYNTWISPQRWLTRAGVRVQMQIVIGLVALTSCVLMFAKALQLVPREDDASLRARMVVAEMASSRVAAEVAAGDLAGARAFLTGLATEQSEVLSAGVRRLDRKVAIETPDHEKYWLGSEPNINTPTHIHVLLNNDRIPWGTFEIAFKPLPSTTAAWWSGPSTRLACFILGSCFVLYWVFLSRMLRMLDPSTAVPQRMQLMMDTLVEGIAIIDNDGRIVMVNQSFARTAFAQTDRLIGQTLSSLPWLAHDGPRAPELLPWQTVMESNLPERGIPLRLQIGTRHTRCLNVNASPIVDPGGSRRGMLVSFDDQTVVESDNAQLAKLVARFSQASDGIHRFGEQLKSLGDYAYLTELEELAAAAREIVNVSDSAGKDAPQNFAAPDVTMKPTPNRQGPVMSEGKRVQKPFWR